MRRTGSTDINTRAAAIVADGLPIGPAHLPCGCGHDRHTHGGKTSSGACAATDCPCTRYRGDRAWERAYEAVGAANASLYDGIKAGDRVLGAKHRKANPVLPGQVRISASDSTTCRRLLWYRNDPPEDYTPAPTGRHAAIAGSILHDGIEDRLRAAYPWWEFEVPFTLPGLDRTSRADVYCPVVGDVGDVKTLGRGRADMIADFGFESEVWDQVRLAALGLEAQGRAVTRLTLYGYKRDDGRDVEPEHRVWDDAERALAQACLERLVGDAMTIEAGDGDTLPRKYDGPTLSPLCGMCEARVHCWSMDAAERAGRSPEGYTRLGPDPDDIVIEAAIADQVAAAADAGAAKKANDAAKVLLQGLDPRRYGRYRGRTQPNPGSGSIDWKRWATLLAEWYDRPDRPRLSDLDRPQVPESSHVRWSRVSKSDLTRAAKKAGVDLTPPEEYDDALRALAAEVAAGRVDPDEATAVEAAVDAELAARDAALNAAEEEAAKTAAETADVAAHAEEGAA